MHTVYSSSYANALPLSAYNEPRKSQTSTFVGEPVIKSSTVQTSTFTSTNVGGANISSGAQGGAQGGAQAGASSGLVAKSFTSGAYAGKEGYSSTTVQPTQYVASNRIVESANRGNLFEQVKSGQLGAQFSQAQGGAQSSSKTTTEVTTSSYKTVGGNFGNNPYLQTYVDSTKKW